jgi:hypothetical protein
MWWGLSSGRRSFRIGSLGSVERSRSRLREAGVWWVVVVGAEVVMLDELEELAFELDVDAYPEVDAEEATVIEEDA